MFEMIFNVSFILLKYNKRFQVRCNQMNTNISPMAMSEKITLVARLLSKYLRRHRFDKNWLIARGLSTNADKQRETHFGFQYVQEDEKENKG